jgi:hypothetical protein
MIGRTVRGLVAATVLVAAVSSAAEAQMNTAPRFGVKAGVAMPMGDFGDIAGLGIHAGADFGMALGTTGMWGLRFEVDYGRYAGEGALDNVTLLGGVANVMMNIETESAWKPYLLGGIGYYNTKMEAGSNEADDSNMAFNVGAGYNFMMGTRSWFAELRYLSIQGEDASLNTLPIVIGLRF